MSPPWFTLIVPGFLMIGLAIPLFLRRIPRNPLYGARFPATLARDEVWYPINARCGRDLIVIGVLYLGLIGIAFRWCTEWPLELRILMPVGFMAVALIVDTIILWRAAENLKRQL
jgi:hypothetical protein